MKIQKIHSNLWQFTNSMINCFLIDDNGLTLIDTGYPQHAKTILEGIQHVGKKATDIKRILVTHCHPDHAGGLREIKEATGAPALMHPADAAMVRAGKTIRPPLRKTPGLFNGLLYNLVVRGITHEIPAAAIEMEIGEGSSIAGLEAMEVIEAPGHCLGQVVFLYKEGNGILFAADSCCNVMGLRPSPHYENYEQGKQDLKKLAACSFDIICFGHGDPIEKRAAARLSRRFN